MWLIIQILKHIVEDHETLVTKLNGFSQKQSWSTTGYHIAASGMFKFKQDRNTGSKAYPVSV